MVAIYVLLALAVIAFSARYNWWRPTKSWKNARVLMYHSICEHVGKERHNKWRVRPADFEKQMSWLAKKGWNCVTMSELIAYDEIPPKTVAVTFDDGFENNYSNAFPILKKYNIKATIYLVPNQKMNEWDKDHTTELSSMMTRKQIREMQASGLIEFGAHTVSHVNLSRVDAAEQQSEIIESKKLVEEITGVPCDAFAYPYGKFDDQIVQIVKEAGYTNATVVKRGVYGNSDNSFTIKRIGILGSESFIDFLLRVKKVRNKL